MRGDSRVAGTGTPERTRAAPSGAERTRGATIAAARTGGVSFSWNAGDWPGAAAARVAPSRRRESGSRPGISRRRARVRKGSRLAAAGRGRCRGPSRHRRRRGTSRVYLQRERRSSRRLRRRRDRGERHRRRRQPRLTAAPRNRPRSPETRPASSSSTRSWIRPRSTMAPLRRIPPRALACSKAVAGRSLPRRRATRSMRGARAPRRIHRPRLRCRPSRSSPPDREPKVRRARCGACANPNASAPPPRSWTESAEASSRAEAPRRTAAPPPRQGTMRVAARACCSSRSASSVQGIHSRKARSRRETAHRPKLRRDRRRFPPRLESARNRARPARPPSSTRTTRRRRDGTSPDARGEHGSVSSTARTDGTTNRRSGQTARVPSLAFRDHGASVRVGIGPTASARVSEVRLARRAVAARRHGAHATTSPGPDPRFPRDSPPRGRSSRSRQGAGRPRRRRASTSRRAPHSG